MLGCNLPLYSLFDTFQECEIPTQHFKPNHYLRLAVKKQRKTRTWQFRMCQELSTQKPEAHRRFTAQLPRALTVSDLPSHWSLLLVLWLTCNVWIIAASKESFRRAKSPVCGDIVDIIEDIPQEVVEEEVLKSDQEDSYTIVKSDVSSRSNTPQIIPRSGDVSDY